MVTKIGTRFVVHGVDLNTLSHEELMSCRDAARDSGDKETVLVAATILNFRWADARPHLYSDDHASTRGIGEEHPWGEDNIDAAW